jgi:hypothetical protein
MSEMKRGLQWNTPILSAEPTSCRNLHCSVIYSQNPENPALSYSNLAKPDSFRQRSALQLAALHFPQEIGIHVENKASHREILCAAYLMWGARVVQRFWYGWKM